MNNNSHALAPLSQEARESSHHKNISQQTLGHVKFLARIMMELMRNILSEIHSGKTHFKPNGESAEALDEFQAIAKRIESAKDSGYIKDAKVLRSKSHKSYNLARQVIALGPLTLEGEQFLNNSKGNKKSAPSLENIIQLKPSFFGFGIDLIAVYKWLKNK